MAVAADEEESDGHGMKLYERCHASRVTRRDTVGLERLPACRAMADDHRAYGCGRRQKTKTVSAKFAMDGGYGSVKYTLVVGWCWSSGGLAVGASSRGLLWLGHVVGR